MARPRRNEHHRDAILAEGITLLSEQGYSGTGLKQILDTVKVPKGSFYHYFESKEAYTAEIIALYMSRLLSIFDNYVQYSHDDPLTLIRRMYGMMIAEFQRTRCQQGCLLGNLAAEIGGRSDVLQQAMEKGFQQWKQRFLPLLEKAQQQHLVRSDLSAEQLTDLFWCAWEGGILRMKMTGSTQVLDDVLETLLNGLFKP